MERTTPQNRNSSSPWGEDTGSERLKKRGDIGYCQSEGMVKKTYPLARNMEVRRGGSRQGGWKLTMLESGEGGGKSPGGPIWRLKGKCGDGNRRTLYQEEEKKG